MMKSFEQLSDTGTADVDSVIREKWSKVVETAAREKRVFRDLIKFDNSLSGTDGDIVHIPRRGTVTVSAIAEGATIVPSTLSYTNALDLKPTEYGVAISIKKQAQERAYANLIRDANVEIGEAFAKHEDQTIGSAIAEATTNALYGGNATGTADIADSDSMTPALLAKAKMYLEKLNYNADACVMSVQGMWQLGTAPQIHNVSYLGSTDYVKKGAIPSYLGIDLYTSNNLPSGTAGSGTDVPYHVCLCFDSKKAGAIATKGGIEIQTDKNVLERTYVIAGSYEFDTGLLNDDAVVKITIADE